MNISPLRPHREHRDRTILLIIGVLAVNSFGSPLQEARDGVPSGVSALCWAASQGDYRHAKQLIVKGSDVNGLSKNGDTPLLCALQDWIGVPKESRIARDKGKMQIVRLLLDRGADPQRANLQGMSGMLQLSAAHFNKEQMMDAFGWLLQRGAKVQVANMNGLTPLMYCALRNDAVLAKRVLEEGGDPRASDQQGRTALSIARERGNQELVDLLVKAIGQ